MIVECPSDVELESFIEHRSHARGHASGGSSILSHHVETCPRCRARMEVLSKDHVLMAALADAYVVNQATVEAPPEKPAVPAGPPRIAGYEVESEIHRGGQGVVYRAVQRATKRRVALKVLLRGAGASVRQRQRFSREIDLASNLRHPNIVTIFDGGAAPDGNLYCAMEYVEGLSLDDYMRTKRATQKTDDPAAMRDALSLFSKVCAAVHHAHDHGVIHRDLKPSNIVVDAEGEPRVLDFGLAKIADPERLAQTSLMTMTGEFMGTLAYASPEQTRGDPAMIDARSDVYSLGVILYEMLTGRAPYRVMGAMADALRAISEDEPVPPSSWHNGEERISVPSQFAALKVDHEIETIVLKTLSKEKSRRYQTTEELRKDIERYLEGDAIEAKRDSLGYVLRKRLWKRRVAALFVVGTVVAAWGYWWLSFELSSEKGKSAEVRTRYNEERAFDRRLLFMSGVAQVGSAPPTNAADIDRDATVRIAVSPPVQVLNPLMGYSGGMIACDLIFECLFRRTKDQQLVPNDHLIESITEEDGTLVRIVKLRPGLKWHDGHPLTADDVVFSWEQTMSNAVKASKRSTVSRLTQVKALDRERVRFRISKAASGSWRPCMSIDLIPKHLFDRHVNEDPTLRKLDFYKKLNREPIGCGPFKFVKFDGDRVILERWDEYERAEDRPLVRRVVLCPISSLEERLKAFMAGQVDVTSMTCRQYDEVSFGVEFTKIAERAKLPSYYYTTITWNCDPGYGLFSDVRVREAMAHVIDVERLIARVMNHLAVPAYGPWSNDTPYFDKNSSSFKLNRDMAAQLLENAGWKAVAGGARVWAPTGQEPKENSRKFEFELIVNKDDPMCVAAGELCCEDLASIGIRANLVKLGVLEHDRRYKGRKFDACFVSTSASVDPERDRESFETGGSQNYGRYSNAEVDRLFAEAAQTTNDEERAAKYRSVHKVLYEDQPAAFLYHEPNLYAVSKRIKGIEFAERLGPNMFYPGIRKWWVPAKPAQ